jgi:hypothetical protein
MTDSQSPVSWIAFATDGSEVMNSAIASVWNALFASWKDCRQPSCLISCPRHKAEPSKRYFDRGLRQADIEFSESVVHCSDIYYLQLSLANLPSRIKNRELILCLDYDHVVLNRLRSLPQVGASELMLSGEKTVQSDCQGFSLRRNISLMYGEALTFRALATAWEREYRELEGRYPYRFLVEMALNVAVDRQGVRVKESPVKIQSYFADSNLNASLFHYGGESAQAYSMKQQLKMLVESAGGHLEAGTLNSSLLNHLKKVLRYRGVIGEGALHEPT